MRRVADLVPGVSGTQVYRKDLDTGAIVVVSADAAGTPRGGDLGAISADGRFVAFGSSAANLVPGVSGGQIYLKDLGP